jgi:hypothetical protein
VLRRFPNCQVIAIDGASSMVEMPKLRLAAQLNRVDFRVGELGELPSIDFAAKQTPKEAPGYIVELNFQGAPIHCHHLKSTAQLSSAVEKCCKVLDDEHRRTGMKIFVTGATGYIGGSVAERLVVSGHTVVGLVRSREKAPLLKERGIDPVVGTLDDWGVLTDAAHAADAVIHAASADHPGSVLTLVGALERSAKPLIYTTGSGIVADSADGEYASSAVFTEDTYFETVPFRRPRVPGWRRPRISSSSARTRLDRSGISAGRRRIERQWQGWPRCRSQQAIRYGVSKARCYTFGD